MSPFGRIGPLAAWELRRLARRGLVLRVRLVLLYTLFLTFVGFTAVWFQPRSARDVFLAAQPRLTPAEVTAFAGAFALALLEVQLAVVVLVAPGLAAAAVSEEKDGQTLPLLLTTLLTDREIVFGKAAGRVLFVLAAVFAGAPVLALALPLGGIAVEFVAAGYALTAGTAVLCAAIGVSAACAAEDLRAALLRAYGRTAVLVCGAFLPPVVFFSPFGMLARVYAAADGPSVLAAGCGYALVQAVVGVVLLACAARGLRLREPTAGPPPATAYPEPPRRAEPLVPAAPAVVRAARAPLAAGDPVLWKERYAARAGRAPLFGRLLGALTGGLALVLFVLGVWAGVQRVGAAFDEQRAEKLLRRNEADVVAWLLVSAGLFAGGRYLLPVAVGVSDAVAGERFRRTLDPLLVTALDRRALLRSKVRVRVERGTVFAAAAVAAVGMGLTAYGGVRLGASAAALVLGGFGLVVGLGAWFTVTCPSDARALRLLFPVAVAAAGWPFGVWVLLRSEADVPPEALTAGLLAAAGAGAAAGRVLWVMAEGRLERGE
jgi:ABC-type Na+ efflux pump permease subunit